MCNTNPCTNKPCTNKQLPSPSLLSPSLGTYVHILIPTALQSAEWSKQRVFNYLVKPFWYKEYSIIYIHIGAYSTTAHIITTTWGPSDPFTLPLPSNLPKYEVHAVVWSCSTFVGWTVGLPCNSQLPVIRITVGHSFWLEADSIARSIAWAKHGNSEWT